MRNSYYAIVLYHEIQVELIQICNLHRTRIALRICIEAIFCILYKECVKSALVANIGYSVVYFKLSLSGTFPIFSTAGSLKIQPYKNKIVHDKKVVHLVIVGFAVISVLRGFHQHSCLRQAAFSERIPLQPFLFLPQP